MTKMTISELRENLSDTVNRVAYSGERVVVERSGRDLAAVISLKDLQFFEALEDRLELDAAKLARNEPDAPWAEVKRRLGLESEEEESRESGRKEKRNQVHRKSKDPSRKGTRKAPKEYSEAR